jgi:malate dehydrogenase (oxaloacetate-decarboxylating)(NADP+)
MVATMADRPMILALANPEPEIRPEAAKAARPDCIVATGRSDYPNQVNNVLCFPYIFRGALDCGATRITEEMKLACVSAIAALAEAEANDAVAAAYAGQDLRFGPDYIIPKPFDPRLMAAIAPGRRRGRGGLRRGRAPDRRHGRLPRTAGGDDLPHQLLHAAGVRQGARQAAPRRLRRRLRRARAARGADGGRRGPGAAGADRPRRGDRGAILDAGLRMRRDADYTLVECEGDTTARGTALLARAKSTP